MVQVIAESLPGAGTGVRPRTLLCGLPLHSTAGWLQQDSWFPFFVVFQTLFFLKFRWYHTVGSKITVGRNQQLHMTISTSFIGQDTMCLHQLYNYSDRNLYTLNREIWKKLKTSCLEVTFRLLWVSDKSGGRSHLYHCLVQPYFPCLCTRLVSPELTEFSLADSKLCAILFSTPINANLVSALQVPQSRCQVWKEKSSGPTLLVLLFLMLGVPKPFAGMLKTLQDVLLYPITHRNV